MSDRIEPALAESLGYQVAIFLRTEGEVRAIADRERMARVVEVVRSHGAASVLVRQALEGVGSVIRPRWDSVALKGADDRRVPMRLHADDVAAIARKPRRSGAFVGSG